MAAIGAEREVAGLHGDGEAGRDRLLPQRQMARPLDQVLQEQVERALLGLAQLELGAEQAQPRRLADVVIGAVDGGRQRRAGNGFFMSLP